MSDTTRRVWQRDFANVDRELIQRDAIRTEPDGFQWVDESRIPANLASLYRSLIGVGAARGWLR